MTSHYHHLFLLKHKEDKTHKIITKKDQEKGTSLLSSYHFALSLLPFASTLMFQTFSPSIFFFSSRRKKKKP
jgi:hypothetical protein